MENCEALGGKEELFLSLVVSAQQNTPNILPSLVLWFHSCHSQIIFLPSTKLKSKDDQVSLMDTANTCLGCFLTLCLIFFADELRK